MRAAQAAFDLKLCFELLPSMQQRYQDDVAAAVTAARERNKKLVLSYISDHRFMAVDGFKVSVSRLCIS